MQLAKVFLLNEKKKVCIVDYDKSKPWPEWILLNDKNVGMAEVIIKEKTGARRVRYARYVPDKLLVRVEVLPKTMEKFYDKFAKSYDLRFAKTNIPAAKFLASKISKLIPKDANVLDIGAGTGMLAEELVKRGFANITLTDFSKEMLATARKKKILKNCKFIHADFKTKENSSRIQRKIATIFLGQAKPQFSSGFLAKKNYTNNFSLEQKLKGKYDLIASVFSFSCAPYFLEEEMPALIKKAKSLLKPQGYFAIFGYDYEYAIQNAFKKVSAGTKTLLGREHSYFIGQN